MENPPSSRASGDSSRAGYGVALSSSSLVSDCSLGWEWSVAAAPQASSPLPKTSGSPAAFLVIGIAVLLIGVVYLATSMSRDVRILKEKLLEQEDRNGGR